MMDEHKINNIINLTKSKSELEQEPVEFIDLGNGYSLVHTHTEVPFVSDRSRGFSGVDMLEVRHPSSDHILAGLAGKHGDEVEPEIKVGIIVEEHKAPGMAQNIYNALEAKYGQCPEEVLSFLQTTWGDETEEPSVSRNHKIGQWENKFNEIFQVFQKSGELKKGMMIKVSGHRGWHELKDIKDSKISVNEEGGGNHYTFTHAKTGEEHVVHQSEVEDMADSEELTKVQYYRKFPKKNFLSKEKEVIPGAHTVIDHLRTTRDGDKLKKSAAGFPMGGGGGASGVMALVKGTIEERQRKLKELATETQTGVDPYTGERAFLLFRGMDQEEFQNTVEPGVKVATLESTRWSPYPDVAMNFDLSNFLAGAWISEKYLMLHRTPEGQKIDDDTGHFSNFKIFVHPHESVALPTEQIEDVIQQFNPNNRSV